MELKNKSTESIIKNILKGGFGIIIPTFGMIAVIYFLYQFILGMLSPVTWFLNKYLSFPELLTDIVTFIVVLAMCFFCGVLIQTKFGTFLYDLFERFLKKIKVYRIFNAIKEIYLQLTNDDFDAFKEYVVAYPFGKENAGVPAFIIEKYENENKEMIYLVFAPTVPNPTSGFNYHLKEELLERYPDVKVEEAFRSIISCGVGSTELIKNKKEG
tara:strand:- start:574 stop:1212 length:639 start_codon:yes stop_codon:yes gene_type:complete